MTSPLNQTLMRLPRRAEGLDQTTLVATFVGAGPVLDLLNSRDHQVVFGRRGTGKTHLFQFLDANLRAAGELSIYIDLRNIGSSGGLYADSSIPLHERGTRLLGDC